jgi:hypothetical protein
MIEISNWTMARQQSHLSTFFSLVRAIFTETIGEQGLLDVQLPLFAVCPLILQVSL